MQETQSFYFEIMTARKGRYPICIQAANLEVAQAEITKIEGLLSARLIDEAKFRHLSRL
jgi:hypothetical protein